MITQNQTESRSSNTFKSEEFSDKENNNPELVKNSKYRTVLGMFKRRVVKSINEQLLYNKINKFISLGNQMKYIDMATSFIDLVTITIFYNDHFDYIDHDFTLSTTSNILRWALLGTSILISIGLFYRRIIKAELKKILYELDYKKKILQNKTHKRSILYLILEIFFHILQPYPHLVYEFKMVIVGNEIIYSINMVLYFLCTLRSYYFIKVIRYWNLYSTERSKRILSFFDKDSNSDMFLYKANLDHRGFVTLSLLGIIVVIYFSLLLKVLEYDLPDPNNPFSNYINNIWYLIVTMTTIGYGDITPKTVLGRIVGVLVCLIGVVILSLLVVTLTIFTYLDRDELVAYNSIKSLSTTQTKQAKINQYIKKIVISRIKYKFKRIDLECITDKYQRNLEKVECNLELHRQKKSKNIHDEFIGNIRDISKKNLEPLYKGFTSMWNFEDLLEEYLITNDKMCKECQSSKNTMIRCLNLGRCLVTIGSVKNIRAIEEIQHKKAISCTDLHRAKVAYISKSKIKKQKNTISLLSHLSDSKRNTVNHNDESKNENQSEYLNQKDIIYQNMGDHSNQKENIYQDIGDSPEREILKADLKKNSIDKSNFKFSVNDSYEYSSI